MKIHLNRGGQALGQFNPEEVRAGYRDGKFNATDLAWRDGMPMWKPLGEVIDELAPDVAVEGATAPVAAAAQEGLPWERRAEVGFLPALFETIRLVLLEPVRAFGQLSLTGGLGAPLFFYVLIGTVGGVAGIFYQVVINNMEGAASPEQQQMAQAFGSIAVVGATLMLLPILMVCAAFITAGLLHLALILVGGANRPFEATFRVTSYAGGATALLQLLPVCGGLAAAGWNFVLLVVGISKVQNISRGRAAVAVLLPTILCCTAIVAVTFAVAMALGGAEVFLEQMAVEESASE